MVRKKKETDYEKAVKKEKKFAGEGRQPSKKQPGGFFGSFVGDDPKRGFFKKGIRGIAKRIALPFVEAVNPLAKKAGVGFSEKEIQEGRIQLGADKKISRDPDTIPAIALLGMAAAAGVGLGAGTGTLLSRLAPRMARFETGGAATITRTGTALTKAKDIPIGTTVTTQRAFNVGTKTSEALATRMAAMDRVSLRNVIKGSTGFIFKHKKAVAAVTGAQMLFTWYAADNVMTMANILSRDVATNVRFGNISLTEGTEILNEAQRDISIASKFIKLSVTINPLLWPFYKLLATGAEGSQRQIDFQKTLLGIE